MPSTKYSPHNIGLVSVILPTYNEAGNIISLIETIHRNISHISQLHEIIVVDDNSPDGTSQLVQGLIDSGRIPRVRLETRKSDRGLTKSIWRGIELAEGDTVVWLDCDFSMPPEKIPVLLSKIKEGYDIAVGSRFVPGGRIKHGVGMEESRLTVFLSVLLNYILRLTLCWRFTDFTSGFIAIRRDVFKDIRLKGDYGEYFIDLIERAILLKHSFVEIPYICEPRREGQSKTAPTLPILFRRGMKYLSMLLRMQCIRARHLLRLRITDEDALA
ncbi:polyprenol monophosphomannose synthase [Candidatus Peregrinibacteria bacterium CG10_big_fil_rev_8_21_14_0_10_54_7]|nr:MAG: polyprenol monophosphomannose synthase [Candidatus Peregrinibacteria bacterium CG10_big_fil_rev_8_21_14_0_10_54_7]